MEILTHKVELLNLSPIDGPGVEGLTLNDRRTVSVKSKRRVVVGRIFVEGYDINLPHDDVERALRKLFSSCGEITDICINHTRYSLHSRAYIYFLGEGAVEKALQLNGSDVGGWKAIVTSLPMPEDAGCAITICVTGYDPSLSEIYIESAMRQHFSSCGEIANFNIFKSSAEFDVDGEDAQDKVMELDGSHMGGRKLLVKVICGGIYTFHTRRHCGIGNRRFKLQRS